MTALGATIRRLRKRLGKTMVEFSQSLGCSQGLVSRYEAGKVVPSRRVLIRLLRLADETERPQILDALGVDLDLQGDWKEGALESTLEKFETFLEQPTRRRRSDSLAEFARAAAAIVQRNQAVDPLLVQILDVWRRYGADPETRELFNRISVYLDVELKNLEVRWATRPKRRHSS